MKKNRGGKSHATVPLSLCLGRSIAQDSTLLLIFVSIIRLSDTQCI
jgi:hypothetical protein